MWPFTCKHPARFLAVSREHDEELSRECPSDYTKVTYHLFCQRCDAAVTITHAKVIGGVPAMLERHGLGPRKTELDKRD